jgi:hypothetical protein
VPERVDEPALPMNSPRRLMVPYGVHITVRPRVYGASDDRSSDVQGQVLGRNVANDGIANYFQPVGH